jgi:hypothetical protein
MKGKDMEIRKAQRKKAKARIGLAGVAGSGKTYSALLMALGIGGKIGMIDTENGSGELYSHLGDYDVVTVKAPFTVAKYLEALKTFETAGYDVIIIDSLSHAWAGEGGLLDKQGKIADSGKGNSYTAWRTITPEHDALVEAILQSKAHIIATMRSKQEYVLQDNGKGKMEPRKVGMAPVQRDGMEYEFTVFIDIDISHNAQSSKDRTGLYDGQIFRIGKETGATIREWLNDAAPVEKPEIKCEPEPELVKEIYNATSPKGDKPEPEKENTKVRIAKILEASEKDAELKGWLNDYLSGKNKTIEDLDNIERLELINCINKRTAERKARKVDQHYAE